MKFPNKITTYKESSFPQMIAILDEIKKNNGSIKLFDLLTNIKQIDINEFIEILDILFAMNKIQFNEIKGVIELC